VDVEVNSAIADEVSAAAKRGKKVCILSFHDFHKTPPLAKLKTIVARAQKAGSVVKVSTMARNEQDIHTLLRLLLEEWAVPLCVIGMGALAGL
jgi:3-dehydroquinate dehydratase type I